MEASEKNKQAALSWLAALRAGGGTEMRTGILEALAPLRKDAQRQVVLVTDGQIGFEHEVLAEIANRLPAGSRVHTVGVGSGVNRSLTQPAARAGRGLEIIIGLGEDPEAGAKRLLERTTAPLVTEVTLSGSAVVKVAPEHTPDLFAGAPALLSVALKASGGEVVIHGKTANGPFVQRLEVKPVEPGEGNGAVCALFAREQVEDLETDRAVGGDVARLDRFIEQLGLQFQISTRLTSWVAVSQDATVDPRAPKRNETVPHNLPYGMSAEGLGLRSPMQAQGYALGGAAAGPAPAMVSGRFTGGMVAKRSSAPSAPSGKMLEKEVSRLSKADLSESKTESLDQGRADDEAGELASGADLPAAPEEAEEPAPMAPSRAKAGVFDKLGQLFKPKAPAPASRPAAPPPPPATQSRKQLPEPEERKRREQKPGVRRMRAKVLLNKDGKLVLELRVEGSTLDWAPKMIELHFGDGSARPASIDLDATTAACQARPGITLVLALEAGNLPAEPTEVWVTFDDGLLVLALA